MEYKELAWKKIDGCKYRADIKVKGAFGVRFIVRKSFLQNEYSWKYIINGKHYGGYSGYKCEDFKNGKYLCKEKYKEICDKIVRKLFK